MHKLLLLLFLPVFLFGQGAKTEQLEKYIHAFQEMNEFSGVIFVSKDDKTLIDRAHGFADLETKTPNTANTKFRIASCTKQFTAIAILQLQEKGKLSVSDKLSNYFPEIPESKNITLDMLLTHRSGIHDYCNDPAYEKLNTPALTRKKVFEKIKNDPRDFPAGSKYQYSNSGYFLLGLIIEKVSGQTYQQFLKRNVFEKAGMHSSGVDQDETDIPEKAKGYVNNNDKLEPAPYENMICNLGCGDIYSTVNDIYKYYLALNDTILLSKESRQLLLTPDRNNFMRGTTPSSGRYAYGVISDSLQGHAFVTHGGWGYGFKSDITMYMDDKALVVVFSNSEANVWNLSKGLQAVLLDVPVIYPYRYKEVKLDPKSFKKFVGQYGSIKIYSKCNRLYLIDVTSPEGEIKLIPETEQRFFFEGENNRQIEFSGDDNEMIKAWIIASGIKHQLKNKK